MMTLKNVAAAGAVLLVVGGLEILAGAAGRPGTVAPVSLQVRIEDTAHDQGGVLTVPTRITGDTLNTTYVDGAADGTTAKLDEYGNLIIRFGRPVHFAFADLGTTGGFPPVNWRDESYVSTMKRSGDTGKLQDLHKFESQCIKFNWQYADEARDTVRLGYQRPYYQQNEDPGTSYAVVTRLQEVPIDLADVWVVEPIGDACAAYPNPAHQARMFKTFWRKTAEPFADYGIHAVPFRLTLTRKP